MHCFHRLFASSLFAMASLKIKPAAACRYDLLSLGEIMLRLDPGEGRIRTAREFKVWEGGGEYNVARGLRRCFGMRTAVATAFADNDVGRLLEDFILQGGVATDYVLWKPFDGVGRVTRNGLNFTLTTRLGDLDLLGEVVGGGGYRDLMAHTIEVEAFDVKFRCVDLPTLIKLKRAAGRPRDLESLAELEILLQEQK
jgi:hypothetical protein